VTTDDLCGQSTTIASTNASGAAIQIVLSEHAIKFRLSDEEILSLNEVRETLDYSCLRALDLELARIDEFASRQN
jgi:hypothetical protein